MLKIGAVRWRGKCARHPRFDPWIDGEGAVKGGCERCGMLVEIYKHHVEMLALMKRFTPPPPPRKRNPVDDKQGSLFGEI